MKRCTGLTLGHLPAEECCAKNCASGTSEDGSNKDDNEDDEDDIAAGDSLGKAIGLVKQVSCFAFTNLLY